MDLVLKMNKSVGVMFLHLLTWGPYSCTAVVFKDFLEFCIYIEEDLLLCKENV